jgi:hypothetical protein
MSNYHRIWLSLAAALLLAAPATADPPLRRVVTDLRVTSDRVQKALTEPTISEVRKKVAAKIAERGREDDGYLEWVPEPTSGVAGVPVLALEVFDQAAAPTSSCSAKVRWRLVGEGAVRLVFDEADLDSGCNPRPRFRNKNEFEEDLTKAIKSLTAERWEKIRSDFLQHVQLANRLDTDPANKAVLLPLAEQQLLALPQSKLRVAFMVNQHKGSMELQPLQAAGDRMQVQIHLLSCGNIATPCSNLATVAGEPWPPGLPDLLALSRDLKVFMLFYVADRSPARAPGGLVVEP